MPGGSITLSHRANGFVVQEEFLAVLADLSGVVILSSGDSSTSSVEFQSYLIYILGLKEQLAFDCV
ncbi:hypothetical protein YTPLAS72_07430 [Nitrospira sp.]|nr:hypothetical protein YTPLAS72_07430 [Nitrospira sp.]